LAQYTAFLDANVLYPPPLRDLLLQLSVDDLYQARWSKNILEELKYNILKNRPDLIEERIDKMIGLMNEATRDCLVDIPENLVSSVIGLPDPNDRHVVAGALVSRCHAIITWNLRDFPTQILTKYRLEAIDPDVFLENQFDLDQGRFLAAVQKIRGRLNNPEKTAAEYRSTLIKQGLVRTASLLKNFEILI